MKYGPYIFVGILFSLSASWLGMVATPQFQMGNLQPTNVPPANVLYPTPYPGMAAFGRDVYRANGCAYCHSQVIRQDSTSLDVVLTKPGTNEVAVLQAIKDLRTGTSDADAQKLLTSTPQSILIVDNKAAANAAEKTLTSAGAEVSVKVVPLGPDIQRGWGTRLSVGPDYLYDAPVMFGTVRLGPDLTAIGTRRPDANWHLRHLYDPKLEVQGSIMPRYAFLFEKRPRGLQPSPDALQIPGGDEVIPTYEARALVAYLMSLRAGMPLFEAPAPMLAAAPSTNQTAANPDPNALVNGASTNSASSTQPAPK